MAAHKYIELADAVKELYLSGYTKTGIAQKLGVEVNKVGYILFVQLKMHLHAPKKIKSENIIKTIPKSRLIIITGSGWQTDYELKIIEYAKANGINYVVTIDHWINIKKRFGEDTETEIPENLLVFEKTEESCDEK